MPASRSGQSYAALSLRDVLEAREAYHVHLLHQAHVIATAVGRYLAREGEAKTSLQERLDGVRPGSLEPRTLEHSTVREWSWPCVLVFVDQWMDEAEISQNPDEMVPRLLYLPDGRVVPTCVVLAPPATDAPPPAEHLNFPSRLVGGGYVCLSTVQNRTRVGSIACLVTDGDRTYALTNRHVAGQEAGRVMSTMVSGAQIPIGTTAQTWVARKPFEQIYPDFPGAHAELAIDAGLIEIDDLDSWTTQVFGVGRLAGMVDVSSESLTLDIIGTPVRAFGAASGELSGEILALFYRYASRSGIEYVADALIGPRGAAPLQTRPGDSGTLWVADPQQRHDSKPPEVRAVAMQWGADRLLRDNGGRPAPYVLATFLSNVCRHLDVEVVVDYNDGHNLYWGQVGHYTIGAKACDLVAEQALREFFVANRSNISFGLEDVAKGHYHTPSGATFYPLADVADCFWKIAPGHIRPHEKPNHYADVDAEVDGISLLSMYQDDPATVTPERWVEFYRKLGVTQSKMGLLPFPVAQLYRTMVQALSDGGGDDAVARALCAGGVMAHYVADACQPLHISQHSDGRNESEKGVHEAYETKMIERKRGEIIAAFQALSADGEPPEPIDADDVAALMVGFMSDTLQCLAPERICEVFADTHGDVDRMWEALGPATLERLVAGCRLLAALWSSAWARAGAPAPPPKPLTQTALRDLYEDPDFAPSRYLPEIVSEPIAGAIPIE